jgi:uncharacterized RDD family membrane protein YckC
MRCPACGAYYKERSARCPECGAIQNESFIEPSRQALAEQIGIVAETASPKTTENRGATGETNRSLIEFPGVNRSATPQWRKELGERVREVQEKRAREAIIEAGGVEPLFTELESHAAPMLELLPQAEAPPLNPLVVAALRRIERAHCQPATNAAVATVVDYEEQLESELALAPADDETAAVAKPEKLHNLAVVPPQPIIANDIPPEPRKPRRLIDDQNDPALNYLDSIPRCVTVETREYRSAPVYLRMPAALVDLVAVCLFSAPLLALTKLTNLELLDPRVIGFAVGTFMVVGFLYLTVSIAFTGRTLGMRLFSLRVVDARTGLIPTGSQSAGRALLYMLSLASAGVILVYRLVDSERHCVHDRFTHTAVIRV